MAVFVFFFFYKNNKKKSLVFCWLGGGGGGSKSKELPIFGYFKNLKQHAVFTKDVLKNQSFHDHIFFQIF